MNDPALRLLKIIEAFHDTSLNVEAQNIYMSMGGKRFFAEKGLLNLDESGNPQITAYEVQGGNSLSDHMWLTIPEEDLVVQCTLDGSLSCQMVRLNGGGIQIGSKGNKNWFSPDEVRISSNANELVDVNSITGTVNNYHFKFDTNQDVRSREYRVAMKAHLPFDNIILPIAEGVTYRDQTIPDTEIRLFRLEDQKTIRTEQQAILHSESLLYALAFVGCQILKWQTLLMENAEDASAHLFRTHKNFAGCFYPMFSHNNGTQIHDLLKETVAAFGDRLDDDYKASIDAYLTHTEVTNTSMEILMIATAIEGLIHKWKNVKEKNFYKNAVKIFPALSKVTEQEWIQYRHKPAHGSFQFLRREDQNKQKELDIIRLKFIAIFNDVMVEWIGYKGTITDYSQPGWVEMFSRN